jgi:hypothetical protein
MEIIHQRRIHDRSRIQVRIKNFLNRKKILKQKKKKRYPFRSTKEHPYAKVEVNQKIYNFLKENLEKHK